MIGEFVDLLKLLKDLVNSKAELDKKYLDNFINPVWLSFEGCHKNYKATFTEYDKMVAKNNFQLSALLEKIKNDDILSVDLRSQLGGMIKNLPTSKMKAKEIILVEFVNAIKDYFDYREFLQNSAFELNIDKLVFHSESGDYELTTPNTNMFFGAIATFPLTEYLQLWQNKRVSKKNIQKTIMYIIQEIQNRYARVANAYSAIKKELLNLKRANKACT